MTKQNTQEVHTLQDVSVSNVKFGKLQSHKDKGYFIELKNLNTIELPPLEVYSKGIYNDNSIDLLLSQDDEPLFNFFVTLDESLIDYIHRNCDKMFKNKIPGGFVRFWYHGWRSRRRLQFGLYKKYKKLI